MRVIVLVKHVPDASGDRGLTADGTTNRDAVDGRLSELDEYAVEQALQVIEKVDGGEIVYLTMGPAPAGEALRKALSMGGDAAYHVVDDALHGSDASGTSLVLAKALERIGAESAYDLVLTGMASTDGAMGVLPAMLSERLGLPGLTFAASLHVADGAVTIRRDDDDASTTITAALPALVSVTDQTGEARYPSFKGIMAAKKKPVITWTLADLGVGAESVGLSGALTIVEGASPRPPREAGTVVNDEGDGGVKLAEFLAGRKFI